MAKLTQRVTLINYIYHLYHLRRFLLNLTNIVANLIGSKICHIHIWNLLSGRILCMLYICERPSNSNICSKFHFTFSNSKRNIKRRITSCVFAACQKATQTIMQQVKSEYYQYKNTWPSLRRMQKSKKRKTVFP